jgi:hypothetical protein
MNQEKIKLVIQEEIKKIELQLQDEVKKQLAELLAFDNQDRPFLEFELEIQKQSMELGRIILEKMIPLVYGDGYCGSKVVRSEEETYSCVLRKNPRKLKTVFGTIQITRAYYQRDESGGSLGLLDQELDIHNYMISPAVRYVAGLTGTVTSFREASDILQRTTGLRLSSSELDIVTETKAEEIAARAAEKVRSIPHDSNGRITPALIDTTNQPERIIYLECDGCYVPTEEEWRECKRR